MSALAQQKQFEMGCKAMAEEAVSGLTDKAKVHFALALMMETKDPDASAALRFASNELIKLSEILDDECAK